jgi:hypothetical protein
MSAPGCQACQRPDDADFNEGAEGKETFMKDGFGIAAASQQGSQQHDDGQSVQTHG